MRRMRRTIIVRIRIPTAAAMHAATTYQPYSWPSWSSSFGTVSSYSVFHTRHFGPRALHLHDEDLVARREVAIVVRRGQQVHRGSFDLHADLADARLRHRDEHAGGLPDVVTAAG